MTKEEFHCEHSHIGSCPGCRICSMVKGAMRRIFRIIDAFVEHRRAYAWVMDTVTINTRSLCGARFMICLRCKATCYIVVLFLWRKSESAMVIEQWINSLRSDPMMQGMGYPAVQYIETDNAGEWSRENEAWAEMEERLCIRTIWGCPDRKEEVSRGERTCGAVEVVMKAGLMQENLPPTWWVRTARDGVWLKNRIGYINTEAKVGKDAVHL